MKPTLKLPPLALAMLTDMLVLAGCKDASSPQGKPPADEVSIALDSGAKADKPDPLLVSVPADFGADIKVTPAGARSVSDTLRVAGDRGHSGATTAPERQGQGRSRCAAGRTLDSGPLASSAVLQP